MSFRHVLSHSGGLTYGSLLAALGAPDDGHPVDKAYAELGVRRGEGETLHDFAMKLAKAPLRYQPGERWMYSLSTDVCGYLVETISGKRFDRYLQEAIFDPLKMVDTASWSPRTRSTASPPTTGARRTRPCSWSTTPRPALPDASRPSSPAAAA